MPLALWTRHRMTARIIFSEASWTGDLIIEYPDMKGPIYNNTKDSLLIWYNRCTRLDPTRPFQRLIRFFVRLAHQNSITHQFRPIHQQTALIACSSTVGAAASTPRDFPLSDREMK